MPKSGSMGMGNNAVADSGTASVSHQITIQVRRAIRAQDGDDKPAGGGVRRINKARAGPSRSGVRRTGTGLSKGSGDGVLDGALLFEGMSSWGMSFKGPLFFVCCSYYERKERNAASVALC